MEISFKQTIFSLEPKNKRCIDCGDDNVTYVSVNNGVTICELCSQIHHQLGDHISELHKIDDEFDDYSMNFFIYGGNKKFKKTLKNLGVNLDMQRTKLYKTAGVEYYRKCLLAKCKGKENTAKKPIDPNEIIEIENVENEKIKVNKKKEKNHTDDEDNKDNKENKDNKNNKDDTDDKDDKDDRDDKDNKDNKDNIINEDKNINNFLNINNNLGNKTNIDEEDNGESHMQLNYQNNINNIDIVKDNNDVIKVNNKKKGLLRSSLKKIKSLGGYIRKNSTKSIVAIKKAGNIIAKKSKPAAEKIKSTAKYVGEHMPYFHKHNKIKSQEDIRSNINLNADIKNNEDIKNDKEKEEGNQIEF